MKNSSVLGKKVLVAGSILLVAIAFQNCAKSQFASSDDEVMNKLNSDGEAIVAVEATENGGSEERDDAVDSNNTATSGGTSAVTVTRGRENGQGRAETPGQVSEDSEDRLYVCVVAGPGRSMKMAYLNEALIDKVGTPADICMTRNACLNIISKAYTVKGAYFRGFCPQKNPHVVPMIDARIQELVTKALAK